MIKTACLTLLLLAQSLTVMANEPIVLAQNDSAQHLTNNECLMALEDREEIIVTAAFHDGAGGFGQLQQLLDRKPWGDAVRSSLKLEIEKLIKEANPFLIVTLTKKQALMLEEHRDLIKWILVQSTSKPCS